MAETLETPAPEQEADDFGRWGRVLDTAGVIAGVFLILIVADIWTDGRLISRRLGYGQGGDPGEPGSD
jgi:hypothetical protein